MGIWPGSGNKEYIQNFGAETYGNIEKNDFKVDLTEIGFGSGRWMEGAQDRV